MSLYQLPLNRVIERRLCREYYAEHDPAQGSDGPIDEGLCKIEQVQQSLGSIQGVMETIWIVGGERASPKKKHICSYLMHRFHHDATP
jgi:hypothetical protein